MFKTGLRAKIIIFEPSGKKHYLLNIGNTECSTATKKLIFNHFNNADRSYWFKTSMC